MLRTRIQIVRRDGPTSHPVQVPKFPLNQEVDLIKAQNVVVVQLGFREARMIVPQRTRLSDEFVFQIDEDEDHPVFATKAQPHWIHPLGNACDVGLYLDRNIPEELLAWPENDRRLSLRYPLTMQGQLQMGNEHRLRSAEVVNYSTDGIGIFISEPARIGEKLKVTTQELLEDPIVVSGTAVWQIQHADGYLIGCDLPHHQGRKFAGKYRPETHEQRESWLGIAERALSRGMTCCRV